MVNRSSRKAQSKPHNGVFRVDIFGQDGTTATNLSFGGPVNVAKTFDGLNRLTQISNVPTNDSTFSYQYQYNSANQRTTNTLADSSFWLYTYDNIGQITSGKKFFSDGDPVGGCQFEYDFDTIGNRETTKNFRGASSITATYTANNVNQYTSRTVPGEIFVTGTAITNSTVAIREGTNNASLASRHGTYFWTALDADNSSALFSTTNIQVRAYTGGVIRTEIREDLIAKTPETFAFDADGNQTSSGLWTNTWSAENRLTKTESLAVVPDEFRVCVESEYDYLGRRFRKTVKDDYSGGTYSTTNVTTYIWDGWNIIAEMSNAGYTNYNTFGLDMSGTLQGAGGVGGLLAVTRVTSSETNTYFAAYDGQGNVCAYVDASDGSVVAQREYSPFGRTIRLTGDNKDDFSHWFSTKPQDVNTGLIIYEQNVYDPKTGRWLSKDSLGESVTLNLYQFCFNNPVNLFDYLGRETSAPGENNDTSSGDIPESQWGSLANIKVWWETYDKDTYFFRGIGQTGDPIQAVKKTGHGKGPTAKVGKCDYLLVWVQVTKASKIPTDQWGDILYYPLVTSKDDGRFNKRGDHNGIPHVSRQLWLSMTQKRSFSHTRLWRPDTDSRSALEYLANPVRVIYEGGKLKSFVAEKEPTLYLHTVLWKDVKKKNVTQVSVWVEMLKDEAPPWPMPLKVLHTETIKIEAK